MKNLYKTTDVTESYLIGSLLLDNTRISAAAEIILPEYFTFDDLGAVYREIVKQWESGAKVDAGSVASELPDRLCHIPHDCYMAVGSAENAIYYAKKIRDAAKRREIMSTCHSISNMAKADDRPVSDIIGDAQTRMFAIEHSGETRSLMDDMLEIRKDSEAASKTKDGTIGVPTHFETLDQVTGGLRKGNDIIIAARPSVGKTALATNIIHNIMRHGSESAGLFSAEMTRKEILLRMVAAECGIDNNALARGNLRKDEHIRFTQAQDRIIGCADGRLLIDDRSGMTPHYIRAVAKQRQQSHGLDIIFIDYLQLLKMPGKFSGTPDRLTEISHSIKDMAKDLDIPVVALAQLNRQAEERGNVRRPVLGDLKGSGTIEEDADVVILLHRENRTSVDADLIIAKQRNGPLGTIHMTYTGETTTFKER